MIRTFMKLPPHIQVKYFKPSNKKYCRFRTVFDIRFPTLIDSFIFANFFTKILQIIRYKLTKWNMKIFPQTQKNIQSYLDKQLPIKKPTFSYSNDCITYTWIGHSTSVINIDNQVTFLLDPIFSQRSSPYNFIGPKRYRNPASNIQNLPFIDFVLISHDHFDHFDQDSIQKLEKRFKPKFVVGLQSSDLIKCSSVYEMDWTQRKEFTVKGKIYTITFVPVCHWSQRTLFDQRKRLWGGFVIQTPKKHKIFYAGDTGYCDIFKEIGQIFEGFDLSILPIGVYKPRQFLKAQHIDPEQAVIVHKQINSKLSIGVHWGTFPFGRQLCTDPRTELQQAKIKMGLKTNEFLAIGHGEQLKIHYN